MKEKGKYKLRNIFDAVLWQLRTGGQWPNLPDSFPKWGCVYYFFASGRRTGLNAGLNMTERQWQGRGATPGIPSIDSQSVKAGPMASKSKGIDGNEKVNGRKRHVITDTIGLMWGVVVGVGGGRRKGHGAFVGLSVPDGKDLGRPRPQKDIHGLGRENSYRIGSRDIIVPTIVQRVRARKMEVGHREGLRYLQFLREVGQGSRKNNGKSGILGIMAELPDYSQ